MNKHSKLFSVVSYITWVGFIVAFILRDKDDTLVKRHLNQALILNIVSTFASLLLRWGGIFATVGGLVNVAVFVLFILGIIRAFKMSDEPLPIIGGINLI